MRLDEKNAFNQLLGQAVTNWTTRRLPSMPVMEGQYCILELLQADKHADLLFEALSTNNKGESWTYLRYGPFDDCKAFKKWLYDLKLQEPDTVFYAILDIKTKRPIGIAGYLRIDPEHGVIEVGHLHYSTLLKKTPAATEAMYLMMHYVFEGLGYRRYEWKCNSLNDASRKAALRLGFKFEGIFRQNYVFKNRNRDTAWFSIIDSEWPDLKQRFQRWLNPNNFDQAGDQIKKLSECITDTKACS